MSEENRVAVHGCFDCVNHLRGCAGIMHLGKDPAYGVIAQQGSPIGAGQKQQRLLQTVTVRRNGHVCAANKSISRADDCTDGGNLPLCGQKEMNDGGKGCAE